MPKADMESKYKEMQGLPNCLLYPGYPGNKFLGVYSSMEPDNGPNYHISMSTPDLCNEAFFVDPEPYQN